MEFLSEVYAIKGRLNRLRYLKYQLIFALLWADVKFYVLLGFAGGHFTGNPEDLFSTAPSGIWTIVAVVGNVMLTIRRLHDLNRSGWFTLIILIPFVDVIFAVYLFLAPGTVGWNRYGADPLEN